MQEFMMDGRKSHTADRILEEFKKGKSLKIRDLSDTLDITYQTAHRYVKAMLVHDVVKFSFRKGNTDYFRLGDKLDGLPRVIWQGQSTPIREVLQAELSNGTLPNDHFTPRVLKLMATLCALSAQSIENDERVPLTKLKDLQATIASDLDRLKELQKVIESLLDNTNLWDPSTLPRELVIKDPRMSPQIAMDFYQAIKEMENPSL